MADETNTQPTANLGIPRIRDPQFKELYSNATFTSMGPFDVTITFAKATDFGGQPMIVDQASVAMSPQHFKNFCLSIAESLKAYENVFGALPIPDSDIAPATTAAQIEKMIREARGRGAAIRAASNPVTPSSSASTEPKRLSKRSRGAARH